jgi:membrane-bound serine protease (ClpP class)
MERKARNDSIAYLRTLAELRGRDTAFAEAAVRDAATLTANQAVAQHVADFIARDTTTLLRGADGRHVRVLGGEATLHVANAAVAPFAPDWRNRLLAVITEPTVAYLLLLVGVYGLMFEGLNPGVLFPGVIGGVCLLLALYALQVLPVNYVGVALIVLGVGLMAAEFAMPSFGSLGIGGVVALVAGSLMLFDTQAPDFGVSGRLIAGIAATSALAFMGVVWLAMRARRQPVVTGVDELLGQAAIAVEDFYDGRGQVRIRGELWQAHCAAPVHRGQTLRVRAMTGLVLQVAPIEP